MCMIYNIVEALQPTKLFVFVHGAYGFDTVAIGAGRGSPEVHKTEDSFQLSKEFFRTSVSRTDLFIPCEVTSSRTIFPDIRDHSVRSDFTGLAIAALID